MKTETMQVLDGIAIRSVSWVIGASSIKGVFKNSESKWGVSFQGSCRKSNGKLNYTFFD